MKKKAQYGVLIERITQVVMCNCMAGGDRTKRMWEFASRYGSRPSSREDLEHECRRILKASLRPDNARRVLTAMMGVKRLQREESFAIVGFPRAPREQPVGEV